MDDRGAGGPDATLDAVLAEFRAYVERQSIPAPQVRQMLHLAVYARAAFAGGDDPVVLAQVVIPGERAGDRPEERR